MAQLASYQWVACDLKTGVVLDDLPLLDGSSPGSPVQIAATLGRYETTSVSLPLVNAPSNWERDILHGATMYVLLQENFDADGNIVGSPTPVWGGYITTPVRTEADYIQVPLSTLEAYMDRRFTGDQSYSATGQNSIVTGLVAAMAAGPNGSIPITVQTVTPGSGKVRDQTYADQDDKTVYSALTDLMGVQGGPEWYVGWQHLTAPERYVPVLYVGDRIGQAATPGLLPAATFEMPGPLKSFAFTPDYSDGKGANAVMAYSSGQGTIRPQSPVQVFTDPVRPTFEYRWTPSTSILNASTLTGWAQSALTQMQNGSTSIALSASVTDPGCPQLGVDWNLGDDIGFNIGGTVFSDTFQALYMDTFTASQQGGSVPAFPTGFTGVGRAIGWQLELSNTPTLTPVLAGAGG